MFIFLKVKDNGTILRNSILMSLEPLINYFLKLSLIEHPSNKIKNIFKNY